MNSPELEKPLLTATKTIFLRGNYVIPDVRSNGVVLNLGVYQERQQNRGVAAEIVNIGPPVCTFRMKIIH